MKTVYLAFCLLASSAGALRVADASGGAIADVVKKLNDMLTDSKKEWKSDKAAFDKFSKYCDDNTEKKTTAISDAEDTIVLVTNKIEQLQGENGVMSVKTADLKAAMEDNEASRKLAKSVREKENKAFEADKKDNLAATDQMDAAIKTLAAVGADQTSAKSADNAQFMGGKSILASENLLGLHTSMTKALAAASSLIQAPEEQRVLASFIQAAPGTYSSQSGQVMGIIKSMKDTFASNLVQAEASEKASKEGYDKFKKNKDDEHADMKKSYDEKQASLGENDGTLSSKKTQLQETTKQKGEDEDFLSDLTEQCKDKTKVYKARKIFAANEEVALSKAIAILDNDVANESFDAVKATSFMQLSTNNDRKVVAQFLQGAAKGQHSGHVAQVLLMLQAGNPFSVVLEQIDRMIEAADDEQKVDNAEKKWCTDTNKDNDDDLSDKKDEVAKVKKEISDLKADINDPKEGLKFQISEAQDGLKDNLENQKDETETRRDENLQYQMDVGTMSKAIFTIKKAKNVLKEYYDSVDNEQVGFIQVHEDPDPPDTFEDKYSGQNENAKTVLKLLGDIVKATVKEQNAEHDTERSAQHDYEDSMESLTKAEAKYEESIVKLKKALAGKEKDLDAAFESETKKEKEQIAIERYIAKLKPGCDFILNKYAERKAARKAEKKALGTAKSKLKGSPSYKSAIAKAKEDGFGKCKDLCVADEAGAECKACQGGISVPGYCAGHSGAKGC